ncbi:hypothetical protein GGR88_002729 [Sphingomonas jejuensis]|uniref:Uncharacterized protein n=1 Tax=Sphingomonas jejuensis TaxID=904715 RepID=A0ABX0XPI3_9SPHN|nr:hypothetical protein [Sphingomonas jejuensis]NJC35215.1 hypothetical protein [Sphingomonas jejuensis]
MRRVRAMVAMVLGGMAVTGCAVIPVGPVRVAEPAGFRWIARPAQAGEPAAALWGPANSEALYALSCTRAGLEVMEVTPGGDDAGDRWRLAVGSAEAVVPARHDAEGPGVETAVVPRGHPLVRALVRGGGPLTLRTGRGDATLPASPIVAEAARACVG